ncbi:MAG: hypothetical protein LUD22_02080 [Coprobacillus sp.]|nr:hypothetical protein [Coprobacillus sp.]
MNGLVILVIVVAAVAIIAIIAYIIYRALNPRLKKDDEEKKDEKEAAAEELSRVLEPINDVEVEESMRKYDEKQQAEEQAEVQKDQTPKEGK